MTLNVSANAFWAVFSKFVRSAVQMRSKNFNPDDGVNTLMLAALVFFFSYKNLTEFRF